MPDDPIAWRTIGDLIANSARRFGDAPAVWAHPSRVLSHRQLAAVQTAQVAALRAAGVAPGDRVAVVLPKSADTAAVSLVLASACCCVPLNPDATAPELTAGLQRTHSRWLVAQPHSPAWQCGQALGLTCIGVAPEPAGGFRFEHPPPADRPVANATPAPGDTALLLQTSGSSAEPKLVPLSHHQLLCSTANLVRSLALGPQDRCLNMLPLFHVGGLVDLLLAPLAVGGSVLVTERIAAREFFAASAEFRPTWYQGVPTMLREVLSLAQLEPRRLADHRLRFIRSVSSALSERLQAELEATFDCPVIAIYGMTETAGVITSNPLPPGRAKPGSVGLPVGPQLRIARADGSWAAAGESGEICVRGDTVIGAYAQTDAPDEKAFFGDWLRTGDSGHLDADGYLFLDGRLKDIINRGGEKIAPLEIDRCLLQHPQVAEAAAFAAPHPTLGEEVALAVVPAPGAALDETALREFLARRLAAHKLPRHIHVLDALPLGRTGKVQRRLLTERLATTVDETSWQAPQTPSAQRLTELWQRVLGVERVGMDDNFFDLGGDSLTAVGCTLELQTRYRLALPAGALYDHPTPRALLAYLQSLPCSAELAMFLGTAPTDSRLPDDLQAELQRQMHGWRGERSHPHALLVGQRLDGTRPPLFWVVNGYAELAATVRHLGFAHLLDGAAGPGLIRRLGGAAAQTPDREVLLDNLALLWADGIGNVDVGIAAAFAALLQHPEQWQALCAQPDLSPAAAGECLRFEAPAQFIGRVVQEDFDWHGQTLRRGQAVLLLLASANRDENRFPAADRLDIRRPDTGALSFGRGHHSCLGAALARGQLAAALQSAAELTPRLHLTQATVQWQVRPGHRWPHALPVTVP